MSNSSENCCKVILSSYERQCLCMTISNSVKIPFLLPTYRVYPTQQTCFLLLCLCQEISRIWNTFYHQHKFSCRYFCFVSVLEIIQIFWSDNRKFSVSVYNMCTNGHIVLNFLKNISKYVAKYTTNERYRTKPSSLKSFFNSFIS